MDNEKSGVAVDIPPDPADGLRKQRVSRNKTKNP
jgi:hypothetical protein